MIHSLLGQSEVLTISGVYLLTQNQSLLGGLMIAAGVFGSFTRFAVNFQTVNQVIKNEKVEENDDEKFARILSEITGQK